MEGEQLKTIILDHCYDDFARLDAMSNSKGNASNETALLWAF